MMVTGVLPSNLLRRVIPLSLQIMSNTSNNSSNNSNNSNTTARSFHSTAGNDARYRSVAFKKQQRRAKDQAMKRAYENMEADEVPECCVLCPHRNPGIEIDYKNVRLLSQFVSPHTGMIHSRRITKLCPRKQKEINKAIERSRKVGLMPATMKYMDFHGDPQLYRQ